MGFDGDPHSAFTCAICDQEIAKNDEHAFLEDMTVVHRRCYTGDPENIITEGNRWGISGMF